MVHSRILLYSVICCKIKDQITFILVVKQNSMFDIKQAFKVKNAYCAEFMAVPCYDIAMNLAIVRLNGISMFS